MDNKLQSSVFHSYKGARLGYKRTAEIGVFTEKSLRWSPVTGSYQQLYCHRSFVEQ